jgi:taurine--2-oxoglutarate transaminase
MTRTDTLPSEASAETSTEASTEAAAEARVRADDRGHVFHSWSAQALIDPLPVAGGDGATFWDYEGTRYLDFSSQLVNLNLGHQHPDLVAAIQHQAGRLATIQPSMANDVRGDLARRIAEVAPDGMSKVFFTNGGADANENAVRMARLVTGKRKVLSMYRSYHGNTATAITLTGDPRRWPNEPSDGSVAHFFGPYAYRSAFHADSPEQETARALEHLEQTIVLEGASTIGAIILETVVGTNGVLVPPPGYLPGVRALCDKYDILYIADEVMVGFGRIGEWFAFQAFDVVPDLITFAKGVNSGYVPLGGVVISDRIAAHFDTVAFPGGLTYSGHPLACAPGVATFEVFERDGILARVRDLGERVVAPRLAEIVAAHPSVGDVRGRGLFWAIELVKDRETREPLVPFNASGAAAAPMAAVAAACKKAGLWPFVHFNRLHVAPPLVISEDDLRRGLDIIDAALAVADDAATAARD